MLEDVRGAVLNCATRQAAVKPWVQGASLGRQALEAPVLLEDPPTVQAARPQYGEVALERLLGVYPEVPTDLRLRQRGEWLKELVGYRIWRAGHASGHFIMERDSGY